MDSKKKFLLIIGIILLSIAVVIGAIRSHKLAEEEKKRIAETKVSAEDFFAALNGDNTDGSNDEEPVIKNEKVLSSGEFDYEYGDILSLLYEERDEELEKIWEYEYPEYKVKWVSNKANGFGVRAYRRMVIYSSKDSDKVSCIALVANRNAYDDVFSELLDQFFYVAYFSGVSRENTESIKEDLQVSNFTRGQVTKTSYNDVTCEMRWNHEYLVFLIYPETTEVNISELPIDIDRNQDFLKDDERRTLIKDSLESYDFEKIIELANEYIEAENPNENDTVFEIKRAAEENKELIKGCVINYDKVEKEYTVFYRGVEKISNGINFVPFIDETLLYEYDVYIRLGFINSSHIYFDKIKIATDEENYMSRTFYDELRYDSSGSKAIEYADAKYIGETEFKKIINTKEPILRFEGENDKYIDHIITAKEKDAVSVLLEISLNSMSIFNLFESWEYA